MKHVEDLDLIRLLEKRGVLHRKFGRRYGSGLDKNQIVKFVTDWFLIEVIDGPEEGTEQEELLGGTILDEESTARLEEAISSDCDCGHAGLSMAFHIPPCPFTFVRTTARLANKWGGDDLSETIRGEAEPDQGWDF